ncbi:hypothetical protein BKP54_21170 [Ensifer sp. 1H6]|nr:hypothetical protein BKP54_21170 [Ensifer sp. 1H6]
MIPVPSGVKAWAGDRDTDMKSMAGITETLEVIATAAIASPTMPPNGRCAALPRQEVMALRWLRPWCRSRSLLGDADHDGLIPRAA